MLSAIKNFFENNLAGSVESGQAQEHQLRVATAALLIEMMMQDEQAMQQEKQAILSALQKRFKLTSAETDELYQLAEDERRSATDYHQFTNLIAKHFTQPQKIQIIDNLWSVAYADGELDKYEEHMVRRIADLIHVSHRDFLQSKHRYED